MERNPLVLTPPKKVEIQAEYKNSYTNLELELSGPDPVEVVEWKEKP